MVPRPAHPEVEALYGHLRARIAGLRPRIVADVTRAFLDVTSLECEQVLWSLEFAFDEDEGRVARLEARFRDRSPREPLDEPLRGYEVEVLLPRVIPVRVPADGAQWAERDVPSGADGSLVRRFVRALADLDAYRAIEGLEAVSAEVFLL